ncbi:hypothetical protein FB45DRAFT_375670, partial [Roridomyces roridus]
GLKPGPEHHYLRCQSRRLPVSGTGHESHLQRSSVLHTPPKSCKFQRAPNAVEEGFFRDAVLKTGARLAQIEEQIQALKAERAQLRDRQRQNHSILSALRRLPPEILAEIFVGTLRPTDELEGDVSDMKTSPWVLTQVSSRWRNVSVSTPSLWCNISAIYGGSPGEFPEPRLEMVRTQVERTKWNLKIQFYPSESHDPARQVELFQFLASHSARWEQLDIHVAAALIPHLAQLRGSLPALRRLWIQYDAPDSEMEENPLDCFELASSLFDIGIENRSRFIPIRV